MAGIPGFKDVPESEWKQEPMNPQGELMTSYSKPTHIKSNKGLVDAFASASKLKPDVVRAIVTQIIWWDGMGDGTVSCGMSFQDGCSGGRLGRNHKLEDVPSNYLRDRLMDFIDVRIPENKKQATRKAICQDLTDEQIADYAGLIAKERADKEQKEQEELEEFRRNLPPPLPELSEKSQARAEELLRWKVARDEREAISIVQMEEAMDEVDDTISLSSCPVGITRNFDLPVALDSSVAHPRHMATSVESSYMNFDDEVDYTCDQIRAMIKIFVRDGEWTLDQFRQTLRSVSRQQMTDFLRNKDYKGSQKRSAAYLKSWDFFNRREYLKLPLSGCKIEDDMAAIRKLSAEAEKKYDKMMKRLREEYEEYGITGKVVKRAKRQVISGRPPFGEIVNEAEYENISHHLY